MKSEHAQTFIIESEEFPFAIRCEATLSIWYDPGVWTYSNGDPGYPPDEGFDVKKIAPMIEIGYVKNHKEPKFVTIGKLILDKEALSYLYDYVSDAFEKEIEEKGYLFFT